jgi:L-iditol 2-dehydrogenase
MTPKTARAAALTAFGEPLEIVDVRIPDELEPGALLVRTRAATVCATDLHLWQAKAASKDAGSNLPVILGHEMTGEVVRLGEGADRDSVGNPLRIGDRIVWTHGFCGRCFNCRVRNEPTLCTHRRGYMATPYTEYPYLTGGFAEYGYVFPTSGRVRVPDELEDEVAAAASCAMRTIVHGFKRLGDIEDAVVVVQGSGPLGLFALAKAVTSNAREVIVVGGPAGRLELASRWGAHHTIDVTRVTDPADRVARVRELTGGRGADVVIEAAGFPGVFAEGLDIIGAGGRYLLVGSVGPSTTTVAASTFVLRQLTLIGSLSGSVVDYYHALRFLARHRSRFTWRDMISASYDLDDINEAFRGMHDLTEIKPAIRFPAGP